MITINDKYDSSDLLFSIPVHEKQEIVNNTIENIFNFNPNCKIILHINKSFNEFDKIFSDYHNLYFNKTNINYSKGHDLLAYHVSNFNYCINNNLDFNYFIFCASNELYIKHGAINYIKAFKNGIQILQEYQYNDWHNFKKNIHEKNFILDLFKIIDNNELCGGQAEGQFFEKDIFKKISDIYLKITNNNEIYINFEAEEIIPQTIFKTLNIDYNDPLTLQNYTNNIDFTTNYINTLINGIQINNNTIKSQLISPHVNKLSNNIFSIKRVDRTFNKIRKFLTNNGIILNNHLYQTNTYYYSNNSSLIINNNNEIIFNKKLDEFKDFQWFGFFVKKGTYILNFEYKTNEFINRFCGCGLKLHHPYNYIISHFLENSFNEFIKISLPIINNYEQDIIFIFDDYIKTLNITFKNIEFKENIIIQNKKKNLILVLFKNNNNKAYYSDNLNYYIINVFEKIYNIYIILILNTNKDNEKYYLKNLNPHYIHYSKFINFKEILNVCHNFIEKFNLDFIFIFISNLDLIYLTKISNTKIIINKINFLSYIQLKHSFDVNYNLCIIPYQYFKNLLDININDNVYNYINSNYLNINLLIDNFYFDNNKIVLFNNIKFNIQKNGFLFEDDYYNQILYNNDFCFFKKIDDNHFYFYKNYTNKYQEFLWCGYFLKFSEENNNIIDININFNIKLNTPVIINEDIGLKTHYPIKFYNTFFQNIEYNKFCKVNFDFTIQKKNQLIIFNFDNYLDNVEFEIKDLRLIYNTD